MFNKWKAKANDSLRQRIRASFGIGVHEGHIILTHNDQAIKAISDTTTAAEIVQMLEEARDIAVLAYKYYYD